MTDSWAWIRSIRKGDILIEGKTPRVVREVHHSRNTYVFFTIRRCSWTTRCYTVLTANDLKQRGFRPSGKNVPLRKKMDLAIAADFGKRDFRLTCCDVEGIG